MFGPFKYRTSPKFGCSKYSGLLKRLGVLQYAQLYGVSLKSARQSDFLSARSLVSSNLESDEGPSGGNDVHVRIPVTAAVADLKQIT